MWAARTTVAPTEREDAASLLDDEEASRAITRVDQAEGRTETRGDRLEAERQLRVRTPCRPHNGGDSDQKRHRQPSLRSGEGHTPIIAVSRCGNPLLRAAVSPR
jgi:hypothetical protein